jgi:hypothetical protein
MYMRVMKIHPHLLKCPVNQTNNIFPHFVYDQLRFEKTLFLNILQRLQCTKNQ